MFWFENKKINILVDTLNLKAWITDLHKKIASFVSILLLMKLSNFMFRCVEHEKSFIILCPDDQLAKFYMKKMSQQTDFN